jgi:hypothetical protein
MQKNTLNFTVLMMMHYFFIKNIKKAMKKNYPHIDLCHSSYGFGYPLYEPSDSIIFPDAHMQYVDRSPYDFENIADFSFGLYAHKDYIEAEGIPETIKDLAAHDIIIHFLMITAGQIYLKNQKRWDYYMVMRIF